MSDNDDYMAAKTTGETITELMWDRLQEGINANRRYRLKGVAGGDDMEYDTTKVIWSTDIYIYFTRESDGAWVYNKINANPSTGITCNDDDLLYVTLNDTTATVLTVSSADYTAMPTDDMGRILILGAVSNSTWYGNVLGGSVGWENPATESLDMGGYNITNIGQLSGSATLAIAQSGKDVTITSDNINFYLAERFTVRDSGDGDVALLDIDMEDREFTIGGAADPLIVASYGNLSILRTAGSPLTIQLTSTEDANLILKGDRDNDDENQHAWFSAIQDGTARWLHMGVGELGDDNNGFIASYGSASEGLNIALGTAFPGTMTTVMTFRTDEIALFGGLVDISSAGNITDVTVNNATVDTDKFLVQDGSEIKYRTGAEVLSDIGAGAGVPAKTLFDMTELSLTTGEVPGFVKFTPGGTTAMDANTYFKMITTTVLESRKVSGDPTSQATWFLCLPGTGKGGVKVTWDWRRTSAWWSASTNFYFSPCFLVWDTVAGEMVWMNTAGRFSNASSPANYDWQVYSGVAYVDTNQVVPLTTWATLEIEIMPQAYPGDAYTVRFRARTDGGGWTEFQARTDLFTQAGQMVCQFMGFQFNCGSSSAFWDMEFRNIKVELLDVNWESP